MLLLASLAPFVVLATRVAASSIRGRSSPISVPIIKNISSASTLNLVKYDMERLTFFLNRGKHHLFSTLEKTPDVPLIYNPIMYMAEIGVGDPQTYCESCQFLSRIVSYIYTFRPTRCGHGELEHLGGRGNVLRQDQNQY